MKNSLLFVGLDVHAQNSTIALALGGETEGRVLSAATRDVKSRTAHALRMARPFTAASPPWAISSAA